MNARPVEGSDRDDRYHSGTFGSDKVIFFSVVSLIGSDYLDRLYCRPKFLQDFDEVGRVVARPASDFDECNGLFSCFDYEGSV